MADVAKLLYDLEQDQRFVQITQNPTAQFGMAARSYAGPMLLPERLVDQNAYTEEGIKYRSVIANAGSRYSPTQKKKGVLVGSFRVELGHSDIASEFNGRDYDALLRLLMRSMTMEAAVQVIMWLDKTVNVPLIEHNEKMIWDAIVDASVVRVGDNGLTETVTYPQPSGHRAAEGGQWSDDDYDPMDDIMEMVDLLTGKGYTVNKIVAPRPVVSKLSGNAKIKARAGKVVVNTSGQILGASGRASLANINAMFADDGLPPIMQYDLQYRTQTGTGYFLKRDVFVLIASTGQDETLDLGDSDRLLNDTLGYMAIGIAQGQSTPGRYLRSAARKEKPQGIEAEGWQTSLPVVTEPEAIAVIHTIT